MPAGLIVGFDPAVEAGDIASMGIMPAATVSEAFDNASIVIFQNNNLKFESLPLDLMSAKMTPGGLIYDMWNQFDVEILHLENDVKYAGLGTWALMNRPSARTMVA
jgi:hypothetical protein